MPQAMSKAPRREPKPFVRHRMTWRSWIRAFFYAVAARKGERQASSQVVHVVADETSVVQVVLR